MNHYHVLGLPSPGARSAQNSILSEEQVKQAYRTALLRYHPDKVASPGSLSRSATLNPEDTSTLHSEPLTSPIDCNYTGRAPTVDAIKAAYAVLSDAPSRAAYDRELILKSSTSPRLNGSAASRLTGGEVVDLDDMVLDETSSEAMLWTRSCRCGQDRGFEVHENELDAAMSKGEREVVLGCHGCSLWIRVTFDLADSSSPGS